MTLILTFIFFLLGLIIGSFLNVVVYRFNTHKTFGGRSACMTCANTLCWYELVPVFSYLALRGKCRSCKAKISMQYPLVELATGIIFAVLFCKFQNLFFANEIEFALTYAYYAVLFSLLLVISVYDIKHKIIPDVLVFVFGLLALLGTFFFGDYLFFVFHTPDWWQVLAGIILPLPFAILWLVSSGRWMGLGDAKLAVGIGFLLGVSLGFTALAVGVWIGAIVGVILMVLDRKYGMRSQIPFGPFMALGAFIVFVLEFNLFSFPL